MFSGGEGQCSTVAKCETWPQVKKLIEETVRQWEDLTVCLMLLCLGKATNTKEQLRGDWNGITVEVDGREEK